MQTTGNVHQLQMDDHTAQEKHFTTKVRKLIHWNFEWNQTKFQETPEPSKGNLPAGENYKREPNTNRKENL